ncbi:hypothetical protein GGR57DRAFT_458864 [Xylariaceae sp. FL1272]|nr:hypothetical protein GGR57DRAFT_458864 [Xylariaceae sp. FL1272]
MASGISHAVVLRSNKQTGLDFGFSGMLAALCALRSVALCMRIGWAANAQSVSVAIAASILTQVGSVLIFIINLILAQRVVRGYHARFGWAKGTNAFFYSLIGSVPAFLIMVIVVTLQSFYTLDPTTRSRDRIVQLVAGTFIAFLAFVPIPIALLAALWPRHRHVEKFGAGRWRAKFWLLLLTTAIGFLGAGFRIGTNFAPRPLTDPAWYHSKACYYCFNFVTDLLVSVIYFVTRFDRRFIVPDKSRGPGDYATNIRRVPLLKRSRESVRENLANTEVSTDRDYSSEKGSWTSSKGKGKTPSYTTMPSRKSTRSGKDEKTGTFNGIPWPPPVPWTRNSAPPASDAYNSDFADATTDVESPTIAGDPPRRPRNNAAMFGRIDGVSTTSQGSTKYEPEIGEPEPAHVFRAREYRRQQGRGGFHPRPLQHMQNLQRHTWTASTDTDEENPMSAGTLTDENWPLSDNSTPPRMGGSSTSPLRYSSARTSNSIRDKGPDGSESIETSSGASHGASSASSRSTWLSNVQEESAGGNAGLGLRDRNRRMGMRSANNSGTSTPRSRSKAGGSSRVSSSRASSRRKKRDEKENETNDEETRG